MEDPLLGRNERTSCTENFGATGNDLNRRNTKDTRDDRNRTSIPPVAITRRLYISHWLSTLNARMFEFGAVLYLAFIFPNTLMPMSFYALARGMSAILFSPPVGRYIDTANRLQVVRLSIVLQRLVVAASCIAFWFLAVGWKMGSQVRIGLLVLLAVLACIEKLCAIMNRISVERDWVVVIAGKDEDCLRGLRLTLSLVLFSSHFEYPPDRLAVMNSQMRRIDLICKLAGPLAVAIINGISTEVAILFNLGMNVASVVVEYYAIANVYRIVPELQQPKGRPLDENSNPTQIGSGGSESSFRKIQRGWKRYSEDVRFYLNHRAFLPSFANALLYWNILTFGGQMVTYLLSAGYSSSEIGIARTVSVAFEVSATWFAPLVMARIGHIRAGIWFLSWEIICMGVGISIFWTAEEPLLAASGLVGFTILSRIGLWAFDLSAQIVVQEEVEADFRGSFSSIESSLQSTFEICSYASTLVFSRPEYFRWPVLMSFIAVSAGGVFYAAFVRSRRGHLLHMWQCIDSYERRKKTPEATYEILASTGDV